MAQFRVEKDFKLIAGDNGRLYKRLVFAQFIFFGLTGACAGNIILLLGYRYFREKYFGVFIGKKAAIRVEQKRENMPGIGGIGVNAAIAVCGNSGRCKGAYSNSL